MKPDKPISTMFVSEASISVSTAIDLARLGEERAVGLLWDRFFAQLEEVGRQKLRGLPWHEADEVDLAHSVFHEVYAALAEGRYPEVVDREDLRGLFIGFLKHKAVDYRRRASRGKHQGRAAEEVLDQQPDRLPPPDFDLEMSEECRRLLDRLGKDSLRQVALLKLNDFTNQQIAQRLGIALRAVERQLHLIRHTWLADEQVAEWLAHKLRRAEQESRKQEDGR